MNGEIPRINLETIPALETVVIKKRKFSFNFSKKKLGILLGILIFFVLVGFFWVILPVKNIYNQALATYQVARETYQAVKNQDIVQAQEKLKDTKEKLLTTQESYQRLAFLRFIPILGGYWRDGDHLIKAGLAGIEAGEIAIGAVIPYSDLLGFRGQSTFVSKSTDERIQTAVATMDKITPKLGEIAQKLEIVKEEVEDINPDRYPDTFFKFSPKSQIAKFKNLTKETTNLFISARPLLEIAPKLLGEPEPRRYLVLFQNDKELRPTGGFITAYAIFRLERGKMIVEASDDIYKLGERATGQFPPKPFSQHLKVYKLYLRDANYEPDFLVSMKKFEELYGKTDYDGIVAVDTHVLVEAMKILGPIPAYGTNFTVDPDKRCGGCPQVIYELEEYAGMRVGFVRESRKDIIGVLLYQIMQRALGVSPGQYWGPLFQMALREVAEKHILVYMHDEQAQKGVEIFNMAGRIRDYDGDYLHINDANLGGAKSNMFVQHSIKQEYEAKDGEIIGTITIEYKNPNEGSPGCNLEVGGLCLNGLMPNWLRIYVPNGSQLIDFKGSEDQPTVGEAYGKTVFEGFLTVKPLGTAQVVVKYKLPFKVEKGKEYRLLIQKQPGTEGHEYSLVVNGRQIDKFPLKTDKEIKIKP